MSQTNIQTKREASTNTSRKANLVKEQRLGTSRKQIEPGSNFVFVESREKSENIFCFYLTKSRECSYSTNRCYIAQWLVRAFSALRQIEAENVFTFLSTLNIYVNPR